MTQGQQRSAGIKSKQHFLGAAAQYHPSSDFAFEEQYHTFNAYGFAMDPSTGGDAGQSDGGGPQTYTYKYAYMYVLSTRET